MIDAGKIKRIKQECAPLTRLKPFVKAVWIYGSALRNTFKPTSDIDILILLDDTREIDEKLPSLIGKLTRKIEENAKKHNLKMHFQPLRFLTPWWDLIRKGEPWAITSLQQCITIYDPSDYIKLLSSLLKKGELYNVPEKSERLLERAKERIGEIRQISLFKVPSEILGAMTEAAQISLMQLHIFPPSPKDVSRELKKYFGKTVSEKNLEDYDEIYTIVRKINRGHMTEISGKETDVMLKKARFFIKEMEAVLIELEEKKKKYEFLDSYKECLSLCDSALKKKSVKVPASEEEKMQKMKEYYVDTDLLSQEHYSTLRALKEYKKAKEEDRKKIESFISFVKLKSLKLALRELKK